MNLPEAKDPVRIDYIYEDGTRLSLTGKDCENFLINIKATIIMALRGHKFIPVDWQNTTPTVIDNHFV